MRASTTPKNPEARESEREKEAEAQQILSTTERRLEPKENAAPKASQSRAGHHIHTDNSNPKGNSGGPECCREGGLHNPNTSTTELSWPHQPDYEGYKTQTYYFLLFMHASICNPDASAYASLEEGLNTDYNEKIVCRPPAISHRLRRHCACVLIDRNHTICMISLIQQQTNRNYSKQSQLQINVICIINSHNKLIDYLEIIHILFFKNIMLKKMVVENLKCSMWYRKSIENRMYACNKFRLCLKHLKHFLSSSKLQYGPQLNLWNGLKFEMTRSKNFSIQVLQLTYSSLYCTCNRMSTSSNATAATKKLFEPNNEIMDMSNGQKRQVSVSILSSQKKAKGKGNTFQRPPFWLGYHTLNAIACNNNEPLEPTLSVSQLLKWGMVHSEALEHLEAVPSFPYIPQEAWPSKRTDGKEGAQFNLTQVPFDVEIDEGGFALDYQIAITFELCERNLTRDKIYAKTIERLNKMNIQLGDILGEPVAILCFHGSKRWSGTIKLHLKEPMKNANDLLQGTRSFILKLDDITYCRGKVFKSFDSIAIASLLSVKITSPTLKGKKWFELHEEIVKEGFKRGYEFEVTNVQENDDAEFAWIKTPSPEQAKKIKTYKVSFWNEVMEVNFTSTEKLSEDDKARKNAVVLIAKNLNKTKTTLALEESIKTIFGEQNIISIFFRLEKGKHIGSCNVQCLNAAVYKKYVKQNIQILGKYVEFSPHPKSLDGIDAPSATKLARLGFSDVNTALANTIQALENAPSKGYTKADLNKMVEEAVNKGTNEIRKEMSALKGEIVEEAKVYADKVQAESNRNSRVQIALLQKQMRLTLETLQADHPDTPEIEGNMDLSN